jgi:hypothetical protein
MPFANVFSIGDVLIGMGVVCAFVAISRRPAPSGDVAPGQLTLVRDYPRTDSPLAPWDSRRSVSFEGHQFLGWNSVQGKPVVRRGTQS